MFCKNCGKEIDDKAFCCPNCGVLTDNQNQSVNRPAVSESDMPSTAFAVLCFFFPLLGLILWLVWKDTMPLKAKSCGKGAIIGVIVSVVLSVVSSIATVLFMNYLYGFLI